MINGCRPIRAVVDGIEHHQNLQPAHVQCDECGDQYQAGTKYMRAEQRDRLAAELREAGWLVQGDHERHVCPKCLDSASSSSSPL